MRAEITTDDPERRYAGPVWRHRRRYGQECDGTGKGDPQLWELRQRGGKDQLYTGSGGIAGYLKSGQIMNCTNYARTTMDGAAMYRNAGGIVGICSGMVIHCTNQGKLSTMVCFAQNHVGGIAGLVYGVNAQTLNCANYASVQGYLPWAASPGL